MDFFAVGLSMLSFLMAFTLCVWIPQRSVELFGFSPRVLKKQSPAQLSATLFQSFSKNGFRVERSYFDLPPTSFLVISPTGQRALINTESWGTRLFSSHYWLDLEAQRLKTGASVALALRPGLDGSWTAWLQNAALHQLRTCSFAQLFHWVFSGQRPNLTTA